MQQTLLALLALLLATLLSFNQKQASLQSQGQTVRAEMEMMALGVAMQTMEVVRARAFDQATVGLPSGVYIDPKKGNFACKDGESCTADNPEKSGSFGGTGDCKVHAEGSGQDCQVVEEFHGTKGVVPFPLAESSYDFNVEIEVHYVCPNFERAAEGSCTAPTGRKEVVVKAQDVEPHRLHEPITYSQVITYP